MRWRNLLIVALVSACVPQLVLAQQGTPRATYTIDARILNAVDDELEGISFLRARMSVIRVTEQNAPSYAPRLGTGTTITAIVRDPAWRGVFSAASPSASLPVEVGWYDQGTYEVLQVFGQPVQSAPSLQTIVTAEPQILLLLLVAGTLLLGVLVFRVLPRHKTDG